ncbi:hypothetical protein CMUS01_12070 [Colletotrichum musicola]|uniref:Uncharacterized protein n=1 Tax=Colletotrichum musicola TaxID=2175873 RepID=A0A8H6N2Z6_9PEZI|nr:hypothetical protein CMUS01_12070 [Colletotrichum musicola]
MARNRTSSRTSDRSAARKVPLNGQADHSPVKVRTSNVAPLKACDAGQRVASIAPPTRMMLEAAAMTTKTAVLHSKLKQAGKTQGYADIEVGEVRGAQRSR